MNNSFLSYNTNTVNCMRQQKIFKISPLKLWEIDHFFKCPVIGMCLSLAEQKQLLKKSGISIKKKSPYDIHEILVASSDDENRLSKRTDSLLNRKYGRKADLLLSYNEETFMAYFKSHFKSGDYSEILWAAAINSQLPIERKREIFGEVHMSMHFSSEQSSHLKNRISKQQVLIDRINQKLKDASQQRRLLQKENQRLTLEKEKLDSALAAAKEEKERIMDWSDESDASIELDQLTQENQNLKNEMKTLWDQLKDDQYRMESLRAKNQRLEEELKRQEELNRHFCNEVSSIISDLKPLNRCETSCASYDLWKKRILIVGGITRMESLYRDLIEGSGGIFEYHDGYMKKGSKKLELSLKRADMVLCPVSCNSHTACSMVKKLAKKHNKTVHMLANSSLSTLSQVIWGEEKTGEAATVC